MILQSFGYLLIVHMASSYLIRKKGFNQVYFDGATSHNFDCKYGGCGGVLGPRVGGNDVFVQSYNGFSHATNIGKREAGQEGVLRKKREADFLQSFNHNSHATNYGGVRVNGLPSNDVFVQSYNDNSHATNYGKRDADGAEVIHRRKRGADFIQSYSGNSHATNFGGGVTVNGVATEDVFVQSYNDFSHATNYGKREAGVVSEDVQKSLETNVGDNFVQQYNDKSQAVNYGKRSANPQFIQNNRAGSVSHNYDCKFGGCGANVFNQRYLAGSRATNIDYGKK